jgi:prefoldin subunit 5
MSNSNFGSYGDTGVENLTPKKLKVLTKKKAKPKEKLDDLVSQLEAMQQQLNQLKNKSGK